MQLECLRSVVLFPRRKIRQQNTVSTSGARAAPGITNRSKYGDAFKCAMIDESKNRQEKTPKKEAAPKDISEAVSSR